MTLTFIIIFVGLFILSLSSSKSKKKKINKPQHGNQNIPHANNTLYDPNSLNAVGINDPILNLDNTSQIPDTIVASFSEAYQTYNVSVARMVCSCPDFIKVRAKFDTTDPRRGCKHLVEEFSNNNLLNQQDELANVMFLSPTKGELGTFKVENGMVFCLSFESNGWVSVFTRRRRKGEKSFYFTGKYEQYGYNLHENRWSYGDAPSGSKYLKDAIWKSLKHLDNPPSI